MSARPAVTVLSLGGTIASAPTTGSALAGPQLPSAALIAAVPELAVVADISAVDLCRLPSSDLTFEVALQLAAAARDATRCGSAGVVVTQGTDTLEEMSFVLDLLVAGDAPVVMTGAMRHAGLVGADGAANLLDAVRTATSPAARGLGCLVVMNEEVHAARCVRKSHTSSPAAFTSARPGAVGWISEGVVELGQRPYPRLVLGPPPTVEAVPRLPVVKIALDDDGWWLDAVRNAPGLVLEGTGGGHVPSWLADDVVALAATVPVVMTSRTGGGDVLTRTYGGFKGAESELVAGGVIAAGSLDALKSRILLTLLLAGGAGADEVRQAFALLGHLPSRSDLPRPPGA